MTSPVREVELDAEREIDLSRWRRAAAERWWIVLVGVVAGALIGGIFSLGDSGVYRASVLLAPGQAYTPSGSPTLSWLSSPRNINEVVNSEAALKEAAAAAGIPVAQLRGNVTTEEIETGVGAQAIRSAVLIRVTVQLNRARKAELAANALGDVVVDRTTSEYVRRAIGTYQRQLQAYDRQLVSLEKRIANLTGALDEPGLEPLQQLVLVSQLDNAEQRVGSIAERQALREQQLTLAQDVMQTKVIEDAVAGKTTARSTRNSILIGALLGLILGAVVAIVADWRANRGPTAGAAR
jgi:uncharacterized protein involved in exopolysaccharide biosynthesis